MRRARVWKTKATDNMPTPAIAQPMSIAPGLATDAIFCGSAKIPEPTVEPIMRETSVQIVTEGARWLWAVLIDK